MKQRNRSLTEHSDPISFEPKSQEKASRSESEEEEKRDGFRANVEEGSTRLG